MGWCSGLRTGGFGVLVVVLVAYYLGGFASVGSFVCCVVGFPACSWLLVVWVWRFGWFVLS